MTEAGGTQPLRERLERFGDPRKTWKWETGEVYYVARLGLSTADVPELLAVARKLAEEAPVPAQSSRKVGRNAPCPCGSGR